MMKDEPAMSFSSTFTSGYMLGFLSAMQDNTERDVFSELEEAMPPKDEEESGVIALEAMALWNAHKPPPKEMKEMLDSIDDVGAFLRARAETIGEQFKDPDDDWSPLMFVISDEMSALVGVEIPEEPQVKRILFRDAIPRIVKKQLRGKVKVAAFVSSSWKLEGDTPEHKEWLEDEERGPIKDHPDRKEALTIYLMDEKGETQMWVAPILRDEEQPPVLDEWEKSEAAVISEGNIPEMLRRVFIRGK
jgi:hypothetical protein